MHTENLIMVTAINKTTSYSPVQLTVPTAAHVYKGFSDPSAVSKTL